MRLPGLAVVLVAFVVFAGQGTAAAGPGQWALPPSDVTPAGQVFGPVVAEGPDGATTAAWEFFDGTSTIIRTATRPLGGSFGASVDLSDPGQNAEDPIVEAGPDGTTTVVWLRSDGPNDIVQAATRPPGGSFGPPVNLSQAGGTARVPSVEAAPDGTTTVVWLRYDGSNEIVQAATRPPGGSFGAPVDLSAPGFDAITPALTLEPDGTAVVAWSRDNGLDFIAQATTRPPGGSFSAPVDLSPSGESVFDPSLAAGPDGTVTIAWLRDNGVDTLIQATTRPPGGSFGTPVDISVPGANSPVPLAVTGPDGTTTVAWTREDGTDSIAQAATRPPGGSFGAPVDLSAPGEDALNLDINASSDGSTTVVWRRSDGSNTRVQATTRIPGGGFGTPVDLSAAGQNAFGPSIGSGPDGTTTVVWTSGNIVRAVSTERPTPALGITKQGSGSGTVMSAPAGIDCGPVCASTFASYTPVTLTASASPGSSFTGWSGAGCSGTGTCQVTMLQATTVTATFTTNPPAGKPRLAAVTVNPVKRKVRRKGKVAFKVRVKNNGSAAAKSLRLCGRGPKNLVRIPKCRTRSSLAAGKTWTVTVKVTVKAKARRKAKARVTFDATARSVARRSRTAVITVK